LAGRGQRRVAATVGGVAMIVSALHAL